MKITKIECNWFYTNEVGSEYDTYEIGSDDVVDIKEHSPLGEGDRLYYDVFYSDGSSVRLFNPSVVYKTTDN